MLRNFEISARSDYLIHLKSEIKRLKDALKYYEKMQATSNPEKKEYYRQGAQYILQANEEVDKIPILLQEFENAYQTRTAHIERLYKEVKQIKKLHV